MKTLVKKPAPLMLVLLALAFVAILESCRFSAKRIEIETIFGNGTFEEIVIDVGASVIEKAIEENPEESEKVIKEICKIIQAYEAAAESYENAANGLDGIPNAASSQKNMRQIAQSFRNTANGHKDLLRRHDIDCREYGNE